MPDLIRRKSCELDGLQKLHQTGPRSIDCFREALARYATQWISRMGMTRIPAAMPRVLPEFRTQRGREQWLRQFTSRVEDAATTHEQLCEMAISIEFPFGHYVILEKRTASGATPFREARDALGAFCEENKIPIVVRQLHRKNDLIAVASRPDVQFVELVQWMKPVDEHGLRSGVRRGPPTKRRPASKERADRRKDRTKELHEQTKEKCLEDISDPDERERLEELSKRLPIFPKICSKKAKQRAAQRTSRRDAELRRTEVAARANASRKGSAGKSTAKKGSNGGRSTKTGRTTRWTTGTGGGGGGGHSRSRSRSGSRSRSRSRSRSSSGSRAASHRTAMM